MASASPSLALPRGVRLLPLEAHEDPRGAFAELFRAEWPTGAAPVQWSLMRSRAGALRGPHVHPRHDDYLVLVSGVTWVGLRDLRRDSPTAGLAVGVPLQAGSPVALVIPHGVLHGIAYLDDAIEFLGASCYYDPADELRCRFDDPELELRWPMLAPLQSPSDRAAGSLAQALAQLEAAQEEDRFRPRA